jgi:hypothetical protein
LDRIIDAVVRENAAGKLYGCPPNKPTIGWDNNVHPMPEWVYLTIPPNLSTGYTGGTVYCVQILEAARSLFARTHVLSTEAEVKAMQERQEANRLEYQRSDALLASRKNFVLHMAPPTELSVPKVQE